MALLWLVACGCPKGERVSDVTELASSFGASVPGGFAVARSEEELAALQDTGGALELPVGVDFDTRQVVFVEGTEDTCDTPPTYVEGFYAGGDGMIAVVARPYCGRECEDEFPFVMAWLTPRAAVEPCHARAPCEAAP